LVPPEFPCNQAGITGVFLKTNGNAVSPDPSGLFCGVRDWTVIFLRKRFTSADIRCSMVAGGADAAEADSCYVGNWSSRTPMSGLRWQVVLVVTTGQYAHDA